VIEQAGLHRRKILTPTANRSIELNGIHIVPFGGLHWETTSEGHCKGVPAMGYLIECNGKRWLFPGDTRSYDSNSLPDFGTVDVIFAHLWLGRGCALVGKPPLLEDFCQFYLDLKAPRVILTHLYEFGRDASDYWDDVHVPLVCSKFREMSASLSVDALEMGNSALL
jgi:hypothetical protein